MSRRRATLAIVFAAAPAIASAQTDQAKLYDAFIAGRPYLDWAAERLNELEPPPLKAQCPAIKLAGRETSFVVKDARFAAGAAPGMDGPQSGQWVDRLAVERCGKPGTRNMLVTVREKDKLHAAAMIPGRTATSPLLQRDAHVAAVAAARIKTGCRDEMHAIDSALDGKFVPGAPWKEDWTFLGCGAATAVIAIAFTPNGRGGSNFSAKAK